MSNYQRAREGSIYFFTVVTYQSQSEEVFLEIGSTRAVKSFVEEIKKGKAEEW